MLRIVKRNYKIGYFAIRNGMLKEIINFIKKENNITIQKRCDQH